MIIKRSGITSVKSHCVPKDLLLAKEKKNVTKPTSTQQPTNLPTHQPSKLDPTNITMSSPAALMTLASDVVVLGAAVGVAGVGLKSLSSQYRKVIPAPVKAALGGAESFADDDDLF